MTAPVAASIAPPGVDHAATIGALNAKASSTVAMPIASDSAINPDAASASLAPTAVNPLSTTANELAKPTKAMTKPVAMGAA